MSHQRQRQTLEEWIHEARAEGDAQAGGQQEKPLSMLALVHKPGGPGSGGMQKEIHSTKLGGSAGGKIWTDSELAYLFNRKAENYCQDAPGMQYFSLLAFYGNDDPKGEFPFLVNNKLENGFFSEGADDKGQRQQSMRHLEMAQSQVYAQQQHLNNFLGRTIASMSQERHEMMTELRDANTIVNEMMRERITSQHEQRMKEMQYERTSSMYSKAMKMLPPLANTISGRNIFPQETADTALVEMIADNMTQEDLQKIATVLKPELLGPLMHRMQAHMQKKREEAEERAKMLPAAGNPEDDAAGGA